MHYVKGLLISFPILCSHSLFIPCFLQLAQDQEKLQELLALQEAADDDDDTFKVSSSVNQLDIAELRLF